MKRKGFAGILTLFVGLTIAIILVANVVMPTITGANKTGWDTGTTALWSILGLGVVASLIMMIFR